MTDFENIEGKRRNITFIYFGPMEMVGGKERAKIKVISISIGPKYIKVIWSQCQQLCR
jgi:hypothetical protein